PEIEAWEDTSGDICRLTRQADRGRRGQAGRSKDRTCEVAGLNSDIYLVQDSRETRWITVFFCQAEDGIRDRNVTGVQTCALPISGAGACGGQFTANTMALVCEFLGIAPMGLSSIPATDKGKGAAGRRAGEFVLELLRRDLTPSKIITKAAIENAIAGVAATGGSTNAVLHLLAVANEAKIPLSIDDFDRISSRVPVIADLK